MRLRPRKTKLILKKHRILNEVFRSGSCSRIDLAQRLNINATMAGGYVEEFIKEGLLFEDEPASTGRGRAPVPLRLDPSYGCFLGLDFEALRARAILTDFSGGELHRKEISFPPNLGREAVIRRILKLTRGLALKADPTLLALGIAAPGELDSLTGRILRYGLLPDFQEIPLLEEFQSAFENVHVFVDHNIRSLAYAEFLRGSGRGCRNFLCFAARSGTGLGIVIDGNLYGGTSNGAGEIGHMLSPDTAITDQSPTVNDLVSATGFVRSVRQSLQSLRQTSARRRLLEKGDALTLADIVSCPDDNFLRQRLNELGARLGIIAANLANLFSPEKIVLAGEVHNCSPLVRDSMERRFRQHTIPHILQTVHLEDSQLSGFGGAFGAAWMGFSKLFPEDEETLLNQLNDSDN